MSPPTGFSRPLKKTRPEVTRRCGAFSPAFVAALKVP